MRDFWADGIFWTRPLKSMLGEGYKALPTNLSEIPVWREYVQEEARKEAEKGT